VFALGVVTLGLSQYIVPEDLYPWLTVTSGLMVVLVGAGVLLVRGLRRPEGRGVLLGSLLAACIAGYTLLDDRGIEHASAFAYFQLVVGVPGLVYLAAIWRRRGAPALRSELGWTTLAAAAAATLAYVLVLLALERAEAAPVAAVRETSVVIAVVLAAVFLRERVGWGRLTGAALVAAGVALLSF
jgi:drug/metabolite transporter (DMT)-like permease